LFDGLNLFNFLICNLLSYWLLCFLRKLRQIFFITWVFFLGDSKLIIVKSRVGVTMFVEQTLRISYDVSVISLFQSIIIKWIDDILNGFGTQNFI
jgi:hypothetical protein